MDIPRFALGQRAAPPDSPAHLSDLLREAHRSDFQLRTSKIEGRVAPRTRGVGRNVMSLLGKLGLAVVASLFGANRAAPDTTVKWVQTEDKPVPVQTWEEVPPACEAAHPGNKVEGRLLGNE